MAGGLDALALVSDWSALVRTVLTARLAVATATMLAAVGCAGGMRHARTDAPTNVVLIIADSLRHDRLRIHNPATGVPTPNIESLAARGTTFTNAWSVTPWTAPSVVSIFTGLYPPSHGVVLRDDTTPRSLPTIATLLRDRGYTIGNFAFFSTVSYFANLGLPDAAVGLGHEQVGEAFARWAPADRPFFAWVHLIEAHLPYGATGYYSDAPRQKGSSGFERAQLRAEVAVGSVEFVEGDQERLRTLYDRDVVEVDRQVGLVLAALRKRNLEDRTIVVFVADHGEELLEHGWIGHASTALEAKLVPEILHVPLILAGPGVPAGRRIDALAQHVDLLPTLCQLLRAKTPRPTDGVPLLPARSRARRSLLYFDTSLAGNLTPDERRGERLQGISDGRTLLAAHSGLGPGERITSTDLTGRFNPLPSPQLERALRRWQKRQATQRLRLLARAPQRPAPDTRLADGFVESITVLAPIAQQSLYWAETGGIIELRWRGASQDAFVQYEVGSGLVKVRGMLAVERETLRFGPFPAGFWNDLATHNPFRFRVLDPTNQARSAWATFMLHPHTATQ
jgi:choline-sulfatase